MASTGPAYPPVGAIAGAGIQPAALAADTFPAAAALGPPPPGYPGAPPSGEPIVDADGSTAQRDLANTLQHGVNGAAASAA
jgi:hypothetical protein